MKDEPKEEMLKFRYTVTFEKDVPVMVTNNSSMVDIEEDVADRIYINPNDYLDGTIIYTDNIERI